MPEDHLITSPRSQTKSAHRRQPADSLERARLERLAVNQITTYRWSLFDAVPCYRETGVPAIGVWRPKLAEFGEERGIELIRESGLEVSSLCWAGGFTGANGQSYQEALDDARDAIRVAGQLGASALVVVSGARNSHTANHARRLLIDALKRLAPFAADCGVVLALQPVHPMFAPEWSFLTTVEETLSVLDGCRDHRIQMAFDVGHLWPEPRLLERIPQFAERVALVQLSDSRHPPRCRHDRCLPGDGEIPLREIVHAFDESGYSGYYELEIWSEELWNSDYRSLLWQCRQRYASLWSA